MKKTMFTFCIGALMACLASCANQPEAQIVNSHDLADTSKYFVSAYIWPSCHNDSLGRAVLWDAGEGEWEVIKKGNPRFPGHQQPKVPLWGYEMDDDPAVMQRWIELATSHGVNTFGFDWYWFSNYPYLESTVNAFVNAPNSEKMSFYLMWADHDVKTNYWNVHKYKDDESILWTGEITPEQFRTVVDRVINKFFKCPNYLKFNGAPVFSIFSVQDLIETFGTLEETVKGIEYFRAEVRKAGFPDLHLQLLNGGEPDQDFVDLLHTLGANSLTMYNWGWPLHEDYLHWGEDGFRKTEQWKQMLDIPVFANASIGYDDSPRYPAKGEHDVVHFNKSPEAFAAYLQRARDYCDAHPDQPKFISIYAFNEWVEDAYLLPDMNYGYSYINAVKDVMVDNKFLKSNWTEK